MIRFALRNEYNQDYELTSSKTSYMPSPEGLGYGMDGEYTRIGFGWVSDSLSDAQASISGDVYFQGSDVFKCFADFSKFIRKASRLKFVYQNTQGEYIKDVDVTEVNNAGMVGAHTLKCTLSMAAKSLWYLNNTTNYTISSVASDAMRYPYKFPSTFRGAINGEIDISNDGSVEAPFTVSFIGPIVNPTLTLYQDEEEYAKIVITGEAAEGESIELSTVDGDLYCYVKTDAGNTNLTDKLDIENENFFKIPIGASRMKLSSDGDITKPVIFTVRKLYRAV